MINVGGTDIPTTIDTGSSTLAFPGKGAQLCESGTPDGGQVTPFYKETGTKQDYPKVTNSYVTGGWAGDVYQDTLTIDGNKVDNMNFVSISENLENGGTCFWNEGETPAGGATGIMGLAYTKLANLDGEYGHGYSATYHPTTMSQLTAKGIPNAFALRLCHAKTGVSDPDTGVGHISFGAPSALKAALKGSQSFQALKIQDRSLNANDQQSWYYDFKMTNACAKGGGECTPFPDDWNSWQFTIFDSGWGGIGTLLSNVYAQVKQQILSAGGDECIFSSSQCCHASPSKYPDLQFSFEGVSGTEVVTVSPEVYLTSPCGDGNGHAFGFTSGSGNSVMGNQVQAQFYEIFDRSSTPAQLLLATPDGDMCPCVRGTYTGTGCSCFSGYTGAKCDESTSLAQAKPEDIWEEAA